ncbi:hypothetical protein HMPREF1415_01143 [Helicobacter pylori GAM254Ai]|nr:hypothetical protein HMPREF1415_01143 [Helicobacter pylori GAM254Ai]
MRLNPSSLVKTSLVFNQRVIAKNFNGYFLFVVKTILLGW